MMRMFFRSRFVIPLVASATLALVGCSGGDDDDDDASPSPSPTPTPTPVPPFDDWFRVTQMLVGDSTQGVDIDGDGSVDNNIENTLDTISTTIYETVETGVCEADDDPACSIQENQILNAVEQILGTVFSVDALSNAVNNPIQSGDVNYLLNFEEQSAGGDVTLTWHTGVFKSTAYAVSQTLGSQDGSIDGNGAGRFGPGDLSLNFSFATPQGQELFNFDIVMRSGYSEVDGYNQTKLTDMLSGGAISEEDILSLVETVLERINDALVQAGQDPIDIPTVLDQISTALEPYSDIDLSGDGDNDAFSIGLILQSEIVAVVQ